jgi:excisionase family DNA binding protein
VSDVKSRETLEVIDFQEEKKYQKTHSDLETEAQIKYSVPCIGREIRQQINENKIVEKAKKRLSVKELADYLGVAPKTIYGWVYKGLITPEKIGPRLIRFDLEKIEQWILHAKENF